MHACALVVCSTSAPTDFFSASLLSPPTYNIYFPLAFSSVSSFTTPAFALSLVFYLDHSFITTLPYLLFHFTSTISLPALCLSDLTTLYLPFHALLYFLPFSYLAWSCLFPFIILYHHPHQKLPNYFFFAISGYLPKSVLHCVVHPLL